MDKVRAFVDSVRQKRVASGESFGYVALGLGFVILLTKLTALLKSQILIAIYGIQSVELDLFHAANVIPEFIFSIIVLGGVNAALIPIFSKLNLHESESLQTKVFSSIVNVFFLTLLSACFVIYLLAPQIVHVLTNLQIPNLSNKLTPNENQLLVEMIRILIFSPTILCISSIFSSILQVRKSFLVTALAPLFYNLGIIAFSLPITIFGKDVRILAYGVVVASVLHLLVQLPSIFKSGIKYSPFSLDTKNPYVRNAIKNTLPRSIGMTSDYIAGIFQSFLALSAVTGTLNSLRLAMSIRDIPSSIFGLAIAQSIFPKMSEFAATKDIETLQKLFSRAVRMVLFWTVPVTAILIVLRTPISQLLFGILGSNTNFQGINMVSYSLLFLSFGVIFLSLLAIVNRVFYSMNDSLTPTLSSLTVIVVELCLTYGLLNLFSHFDDSLSLNPMFIVSNLNNYFSNGNSPAAVGGIALASTVATGLNLSLLILRLKSKQLDFFYEKRLLISKIISGSITLVVGILAFKFINNYFDTTRVFGVLLSTTNSAIIMIIAYYVSEKLLKDEDVEMFDKMIVKARFYIDKVRNLFLKHKIIGVGNVD